MRQAVRKLDAEIAQLKAAIAVAEETGRIHTGETAATHDTQVAAMKLANDMLQQQLARMAEVVPAMLRWDTSTQEMFQCNMRPSICHFLSLKKYAAPVAKQSIA